MDGFRHCAQCGAVFEPRREHARFCSAACRVAWSREHTGGGPWPGDTALGWSAAAMGDVARRLGEARDMDLPQALTAVSEAVWWIAMVDATVDFRFHIIDSPKGRTLFLQPSTCDRHDHQLRKK